MPRTRLVAVLLLSAVLLVRAVPGFSAEAGIVGLVVDGAGKPVPDAEVRAIPGGILAGLGNEPDQAHRTRTGVSGRFRLPLASGRYDLAASHPGYAPALLSVTSSAGKSPEVRLVLGKSHSVTGTVTDSLGKPVPGAEVELTRFPREEDRWSQLSPPDQGLYRARTDPAGRFEVRDLPAAWFDLRVEHPDFVPLKREGVVVEDGPGRVDLGRLSLQAGRTVAGIVVDDKGLPLANTAIWVREDARSAAEDHAFLQQGPRQVTGPDGRFKIPHLTEEKAGLLLYACRRDRSQFQQDLDQPLREPFRIVLPSSERLTGRVVDPDGCPIPGASVGAQLTGFVPSDLIDVNNPCPWTDQSASATTDAEGRFVLEPLVPGMFQVWVTADGFPRYRQKWVEVGGGKGLRRLDVVLQWGGAVSGRLLTAAGAPASGVAVSASCPGSDAHASTDAAGKYRLAGLPLGKTCSLSAYSGRLGAVERRVEVQPGESHVVDLRLERPTANEDTPVKIHGRVVGPHGEPVAGAQVDFLSWRGGETLSTDPDGSFAVEMDGPAADARLSAWKEGYAWSPEIQAGTEREVVIRLERPITLTGRILGLDPEEISQATVAAKGPPGVVPRSIVYPDGSYRVTDLGPGEWTVIAGTRRGEASGRVTLQPGQRSATLDISLPDRFWVSGRVLGPDGEGIAGARIRFDNDEIRSGADGSFEILLANGSYEISAMGPDDAAGDLAATWLPQPVVVADAPVDGIEIEMRKGLVLRGCIPGLLPSERPWILVSNGKTGRNPLTGPGGCYRVSDLGPGDWTITARLSDVYPGGESREIERRLTLSPEAPETELDFDFFLGSRSLTVRLAGAGKSRSPFSMKLLRADGATVTDFIAPGEDGAFHIGRLREGSYQILIFDEQGSIQVDDLVDLSRDRDLAVEVP